MAQPNGIEAALAMRLGELFAAGGFWRERWRRAGVESAPESLRDLPIVTPDELAANETAEPPLGSWRAGTSYVRAGVPALPSPLELLVFNAADLEREARSGAHALAAAGLRPGMRETNTLAGGLPVPGSLVVGDAAEALGALDMPVGPIEAEGPRATAWDFWRRVRPDFAVVDPPGARALAALLAAQSLAAAALGLRGLAVVTDVREREPEIPLLGIPTCRLVGLPEAFSLLAARGADEAFYPPAEEVVVEVLDGRLVLTTLHHSAALTRYAPGVRAEIARRTDATGHVETGFRLV
jgi:hypothetical protein